jgi:SAM-dependent methyltransferase
MFCRTLNALFTRSPLSRFAPTPRIDDRSDTIAYLRRILAEGTAFLGEFSPWHDVAGLRVLDVGCGLGARSVALASSAAAEVVGIDTDAEKLRWARTLASTEGVENVGFILQSVCRLAVAGGRFDIAVLTDVVEHLDDPAAALAECARALRPGGKLLVAFPPYLSPWGAHLFGYIRIPWAHLLFTDRELVETWRSHYLHQAANGKTYCTPQRARCIMAATAVDELWDLNRMTIRSFLQLVRETPLSVATLRLKTPRGMGSLLTRSKWLREYMVTRLVAVLEK